MRRFGLTMMLSHRTFLWRIPFACASWNAAQMTMAKLIATWLFITGMLCRRLFPSTNSITMK